MKTPLLRCLLLGLLLALTLPGRAQTFQVDTLLKTGPLSRRINLVLLSDGYQASEMALFRSRATQVMNQLLATPPFSQYRGYFNVFAIEVPSAQSGTTHPRTAPDCGTVAATTATTYFNSRLDFANIHRLLVPQATAAVGSVLASHLPAYDQAFVLVNSAEYGGSGGALATASAHASATEIMIHEIGHSMGRLTDEYWAGSQYAREAANMTRTTDPATVRWAPWVGTGGVGIFPHTTDPTWQKPHPSCKMQTLGQPFCAVCREAFVERFHALVSPLESYAPTALALSAPTQDLAFDLRLLAPAPNTLRVVWKHNGTVVRRNAGTLTVPLAQLPPGTHVVRAEVLDTTALTRQAAHITLHTYVVEWTINRTATGVRATAAASEYQLQTYPNPVADVLNLTYTLPRAAPVTFTVLDATGRVVRTLRYGRQAPGQYRYALRPADLGLRTAGPYTLLVALDGVVLSRPLLRE